MEPVVVGNFYVSLLAQMRTDYSTPVISLLVGQHYRATRRKKTFQFVSVCLQSSWVPALREPSCLSVTAALFFSVMQAKILRVALQYVILALFKLLIAPCFYLRSKLM